MAVCHGFTTVFPWFFHINGVPPCPPCPPVEPIEALRPSTRVEVGNGSVPSIEDRGWDGWGDPWGGLDGYMMDYMMEKISNCNMVCI